MTATELVLAVALAAAIGAALGFRDRARAAERRVDECLDICDDMHKLTRQWRDMYYRHAVGIPAALVDEIDDIERERP